MKEICIVTNKYPNSIEPNVLVFVQQLVWTLADQGVSCTVICPMPINLNPKYISFPYHSIESNENGSQITVYRPKYIGLGQSDFMGFNPARLTTYSFEKSVIRVIDKMDKKPDAVYGHFVTPAGITAARIGRKYNIPSFMAHGEATFMTIDHFGKERVAKELSSLSGVIAVSNQNKEMLTSIKAVRDEIIGVFPNGYRKERFRPYDKIISRRKFNLPLEKFIICFVGSFDHRKGIQRLMDAVRDLDEAYVICAGEGSFQPSGEKCLYNRKVDNKDLPFFYSAADVFVLPTLNEGSCNAIIEAMACGLPIISSNLSFNDDILDESCSIRIDSLNVEEIKSAIQKVQNDKELLDKLKEGSLLKSNMLTLDERANNILEFINSKS